MFRENLLQCPNCATLLEPRVLAHSTIDACASCNGAWVEWFDGDLHDVAHDAGAPSARAPASKPGSNACPQCQRTLAVEEVEAGVHVFRCGECAGAFVSREAMSALAMRDRPSDRPPASEESWLTHLVHAIHDLFARDSTHE